MTIDELIERLEAIDPEDPEKGHIDADNLLLAFIDNDRVTSLHDKRAPFHA